MALLMCYDTYSVKLLTIQLLFRFNALIKNSLKGNSTKLNLTKEYERIFKEKSIRLTKHKSNNRTKNKTVKTDNSFMLFKKKWTLISMMCNRKSSYLTSD